MHRLSAGIITLCLISTPASARTLSLTGHFMQGGLITGQTNPGAKVSLDGKKLRVSPDGLFVFGLGRNAESEVVIKTKLPSGEIYLENFEIEKRKYRIQRINGLPKKMVTPSPETMDRIRREGKAIRSARAVFTMATHFRAGFIWPSKGQISGVYGSQRILNGESRQPHLGVDIAAPKGTPVLASAAGKVTLAEMDLYFTGGTIIIEHGHGLSTVYSHLSEIEVRKGDSIRQGGKIGAIGSSGRSTGPHLDWRINWFQERLDPMLLAGPMPQ
ncbi:MAG: Murein DD-endopeptidase MepM [Alphaproteobacteria bacterium MarineAlpha11_Bin1]|nr:MAG: Murein DD-endopeptidase MepM [Alphaproteobacteria bacterium MarineAlpha11_Bin1]